MQCSLMASHWAGVGAGSVPRCVGAPVSHLSTWLCFLSSISSTGAWDGHALRSVDETCWVEGAWHYPLETWAVHMDYWYYCTSS